jgi:hypothetical protein
MTDFQAAIAEFAVRQAERDAEAQIEIQHLKAVVIPPMRTARIARVEVRFDGYSDSGAVEECVCYDAANASVACPDAAVEPFRPEASEGDAEVEPQSLTVALESLGYLALERHHPGWELNDGAYGQLIIDVAEASFTLDCSLRFTASEDHSTEL